MHILNKITTWELIIMTIDNDTNKRGVFGGGRIIMSVYNRIDYVTISSSINATTFGNLSLSRSNLAATFNNI